MNPIDPGDGRVRQGVLVALVVALLAGLPLAVWLDLRTISESSLRRQADDTDKIISGIRSFYTDNVVGRVLAAPAGHTLVTSKFESIPGAIPIPATFSLALGNVIADRQGHVQYRFVSDYPFKHRAPHHLDSFELHSLLELRRNPNQTLTDVSWMGIDNRVRLVAPIIMGVTCVACHNADPESPKRDWKVGDVRGIQELSITQPLAVNLFAFRYLLLYLLFAGVVGFGFIALERRQSRVIRRVNARLEAANGSLSSISTKLSRYLPPQIYRGIFSGAKDVAIATERKKLTIFFSDIVDFTSTTERLQPEELTALLNEYFTVMSAIALEHGGTVDKFIGDAIVIFFGDPETQGVAQDARACLRMAVAMQRRLGELNTRWHGRGVEQSFRVRIGINTGYCNVGNFGSDDRMDYTIIGAEANLAARLQTSAEPGTIVVSYETYALVREIAVAHELPPIVMKGIGREIIPYAIEGLIEPANERRIVLDEHADGMDLHLDVASLDGARAQRVRAVLANALKLLESRFKDGGV